MGDTTPNSYDKVSLWVTLPMMAIMTVYSTYWLIQVLKNSTFRWVQFMLFLCVVQNLNSFWEGVLYYTEVSPWHASHPRAQSIMYSITVFLFYFLSNLIYWLFGFKYWVISIEVPKAFNKSEKSSNLRISQNTYNIVKWAGIGFNFVLCFFVAFYRSKESKEYL